MAKFEDDDMGDEEIVEDEDEDLDEDEDDDEEVTLKKIKKAVDKKPEPKRVELKKPSSIEKEKKEEEEEHPKYVQVPRIVSIEEMFNIIYEQQLQILNLLSKK